MEFSSQRGRSRGQGHRYRRIPRWEDRRGLGRTEDWPRHNDFSHGVGTSRAAPRSGFDAHTLPEAYFSGHALRRWLWIGIIPSRIVVFLSVDDEGEIMGFALPRANGLRFARLKVFIAHSFGRKIMIAFHDLGIIGLGDDRSVPNGADHHLLLDRPPWRFRFRPAKLSINNCTSS